MVSPTLLRSGTNTVFFWTIDGHVGLKAPNLDEDVQLIQLGYHFRLTQGLAGPAEAEASRRIRVGDLCTGNADDPLVMAILAHQKTRGGAQDGRISPLNKTGGYDDATGHHGVMIVALCNNIMDANPSIYPRLDKLGELCPPALAAAVVSACTIPDRGP